MTAVFRLIAEGAPALAESLINSIWQGLLLVIVVWLALRALPRINATTRYGIWWATMLAVALLPVLNAKVVDLRSEPPLVAVDGKAEIPDQPNATVVATSPTVATHPTPIAALERAIHQLERRQKAAKRLYQAGAGAPVRNVEPPPVAEPVARNLRSDPAEAAADNSGSGVIEKCNAVVGSLADVFPIKAPSGRGLQFFLAVIGMGILAGSMRLLVGCVRMRWIKRGAEILPAHLQESIGHQAAALGLRRRVALAASRDVRVPTAIGFCHPVVMIPAGLIEELTDSELEQVTLHELAHLRRWDDWTNLAQRLIEALFFFHPAIRWAGRQICLEREIACDDWVVTQTGRVRPYAVCLTRLVALSRWSGRTEPALGFVRTKSQFTRRIEALLDRRRNARPVMSRLALAVVSVFLVAVLLQVGRLPAVFAVSSPASPVSHPVLALTPSAPRAAILPVRARVAAAFASADPAVSASAIAIAVSTLPSCEPRPALSVTTGTSLAPFACDWNSSFSFDFGMSSPQLTSTPAPGLFSTEDYSPREPDGSLRVTYAQLEQLLGMGIDGDVVRHVRETAFPGVTVGELMTLKTSGVDLELLEALHSAGYRGYSVDDAATLALHGITASFVAGLASSGIKPPSLDDLVRFQLQGVQPEYVREIADYGFASLSTLDVMNLRLMGITGEFLSSLHDAGLTSFSPGDVMLLRQYGVEAKFAGRVADFGFRDLTAKDLIALRIAGVNESFLASLSGQEVTGLSPGQVVRLRATGLSAEFLRGAIDYGFDDLDVSDLAVLQNFGVTDAYLTALSKAGLPDLDVDEITDLKGAGISPAYAEAVLRYGFADPGTTDIVNLRNAGVSEPYLAAFAKIAPSRLTPDELIRLRSQGVSPEYAGAVYAFGFADPSPDDIVLLSMYGVSQPYLADLGAMGLGIEPEDVIDLVQNGISVTFIEAWRRSGRSEIDVEDMIRLRSMGIRPGSREDSDAIESPGE